MKRIIGIIGLIIIIGACTQNVQDTEYIKEIESYRAEVNEKFAKAESSPLTAEGLQEFNGLAFFPVDKKYCIEARFTLNPDPEPFGMETTTERRPIYVKYGEAHFSLDGEDFVLEIYQSEKAKQMEEFKEHLFLPFKDLSNGNESYGGGRFIDLKIPEEESIVIDFNKAYNPYCAYNHKYSCPIPPEVNHLNIDIAAGVKAYDKH